jgi:hypothetical protein
MTTTIAEQQNISAVLTAVIGLLAVVTGSAVFTGNNATALVSICATIIIGLINHFQTATTTAAA